MLSINIAEYVYSYTKLFHVQKCSMSIWLHPPQTLPEGPCSAQKTRVKEKISNGIYGSYIQLKFIKK